MYIIRMRGPGAAVEPRAGGGAGGLSVGWQAAGERQAEGGRQRAVHGLHLIPAGHFLARGANDVTDLFVEITLGISSLERFPSLFSLARKGRKREPAARMPRVEERGEG